MEHDGRAAPARGKLQGHSPAVVLRHRRALRPRAGQRGLVSTRDRADRAPSFLTLRCKISRPGIFPGQPPRPLHPSPWPGRDVGRPGPRCPGRACRAAEIGWPRPAWPGPSQTLRERAPRAARGEFGGKVNPPTHRTDRQKTAARPGALQAPASTVRRRPQVYRARPGAALPRGLTPPLASEAGEGAPEPGKWARKKPEPAVPDAGFGPAPTPRRGSGPSAARPPADCT